METLALPSFFYCLIAFSSTLLQFCIAADTISPGQSISGIQTSFLRPSFWARLLTFRQQQELVLGHMVQEDPRRTCVDSEPEQPSHRSFCSFHHQQQWNTCSPQPKQPHYLVFKSIQASTDSSCSTF